MAALLLILPFEAVFCSVKENIQVFRDLKKTQGKRELNPTHTFFMSYHDPWNNISRDHFTGQRKWSPNLLGIPAKMGAELVHNKMASLG